MSRIKKRAILSSKEKMNAALGIRGIMKKGAVPAEKMSAFSKFLRTKKGEEWAKIHLTPIHSKKRKRK